MVRSWAKWQIVRYKCTEDGIKREKIMQIMEEIENVPADCKDRVKVPKYLKWWFHPEAHERMPQEQARREPAKRDNIREQ
jgi:hypothetical protein